MPLSGGGWDRIGELENYVAVYEQTKLESFLNARRSAMYGNPDFGNALGQKVDLFQQATIKLKANGYDVQRSDFPPPPFPGNYSVIGPKSIPELTEMQVISFAQTMPI